MFRVSFRQTERMSVVLGSINQGDHNQTLVVSAICDDLIPRAAACRRPGDCGFISQNAIFFISAAAGKLGADGLATYNSVSFRMARSAKARSLYFSTLVLALCAVPFAALIIVVALRFIAGGSPHLADDLPIILGSSAFAFCQFQGAILQAQKRTARSSLVFLVIPYAFVFASLWLPRPLHPIWMLLGLAVSC